MQFRYTLATPADDADIRRLLRENPVPGNLTLGYEREPDFFQGCLDPTQVVLAREAATGALAGLFCRSVRQVYLNGEPQAVGYISGLRVAPQFRGRWLVSRGVAMLRELDQDGQVPGYFATMIEGNREAEAVLVSKARQHFPTMRPVERLASVAVLVRRSLPPWPSDLVVSSGGLEEVRGFLTRHGREKQFFPVDVTGPQEWLLVRRGGELVGACALWDQSGFKQSVVRGYSGLYAWGRPLYNLLARLQGGQPLPPVGAQLRQLYVSFACVAGNDPALFAPLLRTAYNLAAARGYGYLLVGLSTRDSLLAAVTRYAHIPYYSTLYTVAWKDGVTFHDRPDGRIAYPEIASL